ncbi:MAG: zinc-binding dehydrogenase [Gemmatimonadaceae bacterium]
MRALTIDSHGELDRLQFREDLPIPEVHSSTDVRVRIRAAALNHLDLFVIRGLPGIRLSSPWVMGADGAGVVDAVGRGVGDLNTGDRVLINPGISDRTCEYCVTGEHSLCVRYGILGEHFSGTMADYVVVPAANLRAVPSHISWESAAAYPLAALTAWRMVVTRAAVQEGENVLIWGIGGGVALASLQIAKMLGARVWVTSGSDEKLARARELGADETINYTKQEIAREIRARTSKRGVDVVIDNVGQSTWAQSLAALGKRGRLVTCGATSGPLVETDVRRLFWNQWTLMGSTMGNDREFDAILKALGDGTLAPVVDSIHDLENGRSAFERLASGEQFGKIVVRVSTD